MDVFDDGGALTRAKNLAELFRSSSAAIERKWWLVLKSACE